ncbi:PilZ domain-containing protein [Novosphingobium sp. TH158]|uniref:PilZ domain-containing protein n=1 Tax=Novosphingobium sp. TH158 TaxID=2067455 RepID=UPI000C7BBBE4|nr:PilZ domain-containing protein [Novosphingobium sp. TH158]PLK25644.1 PilZ domain-containing protein [Novosphingobium sp. TH158]
MTYERPAALFQDTDDRVGRRRSPRQYVQAEVQFGQKGRRTRVRLLDLSCHGARLSLFHKLTPGETFWLTLPGLAPLSARISWSNGHLAGCEFVEPLHPATFDDLLNGSPRSKPIDRRRLSV